MVYNDFSSNIVSCGASFDYAWDGATHHTYFDLAMLRMLPGRKYASPARRLSWRPLCRANTPMARPPIFVFPTNPMTSIWGMIWRLAVVSYW